MLLANLMHLSRNMWSDFPLRPGEIPFLDRPDWYSEDLLLDEDLWTDLTAHMPVCGFNGIVIDLGNAVKYNSHPEIAVKNAWSTRRLRNELGRLRALGLEPIPKLNFSATHDAWLTTYSKQVSTPIYYQVVSDLIREVIEIFDTPRLFHLGMDEETAENQRDQSMIILRQKDLWWHDLGFLVNEVEEAGSRAWVWADHAWRDPQTYFERMSPSVVQSNWYYEESFSGAVDEIRPRPLNNIEEAYLTYLDLEDHHFDQIPASGTFEKTWKSCDKTFDFAQQHIDESRLIGFLQTSWTQITNEFRDFHFQTLESGATRRLELLQQSQAIGNVDIYWGDQTLP